MLDSPIMGDEKENFYFISKYAHILRAISYMIKKQKSEQKCSDFFAKTGLCPVFGLKLWRNVDFGGRSDKSSFFPV